MKFRKTLLAAVAVLALVATGYVAAQVTLPQVATLGQSDVTNVLPNGLPVVGNQYAPLGWIASIDEYSVQVPVTAFSITVPNGVDFLVLNPAGTLATGTLTMAATAFDGQKFCLYDSQTQTAITIQANTGQTLNTTIGIATPTALTAKTMYCWRYIAAQGWIRTS